MIWLLYRYTHCNAVKFANALISLICLLGSAVATDSSVVEMNAALRVASVKEILYILGIKALMRDRVAEEHHGIAVLKVEGRRNVRRSILGKTGNSVDKDGGADSSAKQEMTKDFHF